MPDITLYNSICEVLEISVNELLSGEKIDNKKYQEKFEENMINVLSGVELKNNNLRKVNLVVFFISVFIISFILFNYICSHIYLKHDYDKSIISVSLNNDALELSTPSMGESKYACLEYQDECLVFVTYYQILEDKKKNKKIIDKQFEYNTYIRDFFKDNKDKSLEQAIKCWKYKKSLKGHNKYEREDLKILNNQLQNKI